MVVMVLLKMRNKKIIKVNDKLSRTQKFRTTSSTSLESVYNAPHFSLSPWNLEDSEAIWLLKCITENNKQEGEHRSNHWSMAASHHQPLGRVSALKRNVWKKDWNSMYQNVPNCGTRGLSVMGDVLIFFFTFLKPFRLFHHVHKFILNRKARNNQKKSSH